MPSHAVGLFERFKVEFGARKAGTTEEAADGEAEEILYPISF
jgi:hypothetical protein